MDLLGPPRGSLARVLLPYNFLLLRESYRRHMDALLGLCEQRDVAVQTIESIARRRWTPDQSGARRSWYQPLDDAAAVERI